MNSFDFWICLSIIIPCSFCSVWIFRIPYKVVHNSLELATGNECVTTDFSIFFKNENGLTILSSLSSSTHTCTTGTDNDYIVCFIDIVLSLVFNCVLLELIHVCSFCLFSSVIQSVLNSTACECSTGYCINTGTVSFLGICEHNIICRCTNMSSFLGVLYFDVCNCIVRESYVQCNCSIITFTSTCISTCCVS